MMYQISTQSISSSLRQSILKLQSELAARSTELSTGKHADNGLFLGAQSGTLVSLEAESSLLQAMIGTNETASTRLGTTQTVLEQLQTSAERQLNMLIANNSTAANAQMIEASGKAELEALIANLNSSLQGNFLFAGTNTSTKPITDYFGTSAASKQAVDNAFSATFGMSQSSPGVGSITGTDMQNFLDNQFASLFQGANWTSDWSSAADDTLTQRITGPQWVSTSVSANAIPFKDLARAYTMIADLGTENLGAEALRAVTGTAQNLLRSAIADLTQLRTSVGMVQSSIKDADNRLTIQTDLLATQVSKLDSVNTYEVATRLTELQTQIETSYSLTSRIQRLSLVNFL